MDASRVRRVREDMERADARRLQPHYIESFFLEAFQQLAGTVRQREPRRYEVTHVPAPVRNRDGLIGHREVIVPRYERIALEQSLLARQGPPLPPVVSSGRPLHARSRASRRSSWSAIAVDREDARRGQRSSDQGDQPLGPSGRPTQAAGAGRQAERAAELTGGAPKSRRSSRAYAEPARSS